MKNKILKLIYVLAELCEKDISDDLALMYYKALESYPETNVTKVLTHMVAKRTRFPALAEIIELLDPKPDQKDDAAEAANLIWSAISKFGSPNSKQARDFMGSLAWEVVERMGGWTNLCQLSLSDRGTFVAQARELATAVHKKSSLGILHKRPMLGGKTNLDQILLTG